MKKIKILFIIWSYSYGGGAEALLTMIVNHLNSEKYDISIIEYEHADLKQERANNYVHVLPEIKKIDVSDKTTKGYQVYHTPEILIDRYIKGDYDLYISFNYQIPTFLLPEETKNIAWIHTNVYDLGEKSAKREWDLQDKAFDKVKRIVSISELTTRSLNDLFPRHKNKIIEIYNGIDIEETIEKSLEYTSVQLEQPSIVFFGRLEERKEPGRLIHILSLVHKRGEDVHLYFLGDGKLKEQIIQKTQDYDLEHFVHLLGYKENPFPIVRQCNLCCLLSKAEGFPMSLMECVALGKPFIGTKTGGMEILSNHQRCGRIVNTDEEATEAIVQLLKCDKFEMEVACLESIKRFDIKEYIVKIESLFDSVLFGTDAENS